MPSRPRPGFTPNGVVALATDFGTRDGYVGAMKGVILRVSERLRIVDVAHDLPPQDVTHASFALRAAYPHFPRGTVHLAVVDPGVGSERAPVALLAGGQALIGPDNGLLGPAAAALGGHISARRIERRGVLTEILPARPSATFHGRDVFAPVAAALASGQIAFEDVGPPHRVARLILPRPRRLRGALCGVITHFDRFGNAITNLGEAQLGTERGPGGLRIELPGGERVRVVETYAQAARDEVVALVGSDGWLEIAVRDGSARDRVGLGASDQVRVLDGRGPRRPADGPTAPTRAPDRRRTGGR